MNHGHQTALLNQLWGSAFIEALLFNGVTQFVISPGSRSTPLTAAVARHPKAQKTIVYDERSAAYYALGYARATGRPAALICTSGTAAANYLPAVVEASVDCQPLMVLTADRPPELRQTGANQTIVQPGIFGSYPRWQFDFPCPDAAISLNMIDTGIAQAVHFALRSPAGPVHLNCMFREPFFDMPEETSVVSFSPKTRFSASLVVSDRDSVAVLAAQISRATRTLIVAGRGLTEATANSVAELARRYNIPVAPDIQSQLRLGNRHEQVLHYFDQMLLSEEIRTRYRPQVVLHFGPPAVSKRLAEWLKAVQPETYAVIAESPYRYDPNHQVTLRIDSDITHFCLQLGDLLPGKKGETNPILQTLFRASQQVDRVISQSINIAADRISEISAARLLSQFIQSGWGLFLGSSMPIRDMDMFATASGAHVRVAANRGASGIDGTVAAACGFAAGSNSPVVLLLGDLSLLHDLNSLLLVQRSQQPVIIVVINNGGGGIFSFLPVAGQSDIFETYFGTPHSLTFRHCAEQFGLAYSQPANNGAFSKILTEWQQMRKSGIIEVISDRGENPGLHRTLQQKIREQINELFTGAKP